MDEKNIHIERREVEAYVERETSSSWKTWKCEIKVQPDDRTHNDWFFWFTLPFEKDEDKNKELIGAEVYMAYGHKLYVSVSEIVYNEVGERIKNRPLFTDMDNLNNMVKHTKKIIKQFEEKYGL